MIRSIIRAIADAEKACPVMVEIDKPEAVPINGNATALHVAKTDALIPLDETGVIDPENLHLF
jgi:hypothetical protein